MAYTFGQAIPVTGLLAGFPGKVSRLGERVIAARQVLATTTNPITFGQAVVIVTASDAYQSVADFIAGGGTFTAPLFAGIAISEVETTGGYPYSPTAPTSGSYLQGNMAEALERGSITVYIQPAAPGSPVSQGPVFLRISTNGTYPSAVVGGLEAAADGGHTVQLTNVVFRTSQLDANNVAEITLLNRVAA